MLSLVFLFLGRKKKCLRCKGLFSHGERNALRAGNVPGCKINAVTVDPWEYLARNYTPTRKDSKQRVKARKKKQRIKNLFARVGLILML